MVDDVTYKLMHGEGDDEENMEDRELLDEGRMSTESHLKILSCCSFLLLSAVMGSITRSGVRCPLGHRLSEH